MASQVEALQARQAEMEARRSADADALDRLASKVEALEAREAEREGRRSADGDALGHLASRVEALEAGSRALASALEAREAECEKLRLEQLILARRLDAAQAQSQKAVTGLFERLEALRGRMRPADTGAPHKRS